MSTENAKISTHETVHAIIYKTRTNKSGGIKLEPEKVVVEGEQT